MKAYFSEDPIVAVSTGTTEKSALGIIRLSGFNNLDFLSELTRRKVIPESHSAFFSRIYDSEGLLLDEGVITYFQAPKSFTGENVLELSVHGNPFNMERIVMLLRNKFGFRLAEPGEFSYRALRNGKLNITQVEGLDLVLNASSEFGLNAGLKALNNDLYDDYLQVRNNLLELKASVELAIDFAEDVGEEEIQLKLKKEIESLHTKMALLKKRCEGDLGMLLQPKVALVGATNAGKSTYFNRLLGTQRAIVSDIHGTTRDYLSEYIYINSQAFLLLDTAGIRDGAEEIEKLGIEHSLRLLKESFFKVLVINPFDWKEESSWEKGHKVDAIVLTHSDLPGFEERARLIFEAFSGFPIYKTGPIGPENNNGPIGPVLKSGPMGAVSEIGPIGADSCGGPIGPENKSGSIGAENGLKSQIIEKYRGLMETNPVPLSRHRHVITSAYDIVNKIYSEEDLESDMAILSSKVKEIGSKLDELIGVVQPQEVLDHIFANFCIGK